MYQISVYLMYPTDIKKVKKLKTHFFLDHMGPKASAI